MLAQAAHETGWGQREIRQADGSSANNLFGIKAGSGWKGAGRRGHDDRVRRRPAAQAEPALPRLRVGGRVVPRLRAADEGQRAATRQVLASGGSAERFAQGLQEAGYATDPAYADKLGRVINTTLRLQRAVT